MKYHTTGKMHGVLCRILKNCNRIWLQLSNPVFHPLQIFHKAYLEGNMSRMLLLLSSGRRFRLWTIILFQFISISLYGQTDKIDVNKTRSVNFDSTSGIQGKLPATKVTKIEKKRGSFILNFEDEEISSEYYLTPKEPLSILEETGSQQLTATGPWSVPDEGYRKRWFTNNSFAPPGATVTNVTYRIRIDDEGDPNSFYCRDYEIYISSSSSSGTQSDNLVYNNLGGRTDGGYDDDVEDDSDIYLNWRSTNYFDGEDANQYWGFEVYDNLTGDQGEVDYFGIEIFWETQTQPLSLNQGSCYINPTSQTAGNRITVYYSISNPNSFSVDLGLGCSIAPEGTQNWLNDEPNDRVISAPPGNSLYSRYFDIPSSASPGLYTVWWAIKEGDMNGPNMDEFQRNDLTVTLPEPTLYPITPNPSYTGNYTLSWSTVPSANSYELQWDTNSSFSSPDGSFIGTGTSYGVVEESLGTHYYRVRAKSGSYNSDWSNIESVLVELAAPSNVQANGISTSEIQITWNDNSFGSNNEDGFYILESNDGSNWINIATRPSNSTSYTRTGLNPGTTRYYAVRAFKGAYLSDFSNTAVGTTFDVPSADITEIYFDRTTVNANDPFLLRVSLQNIGGGAADNGGISISFPDVDEVNQWPSNNNYQSNQADILRNSSSTFASEDVIAYDFGSTIVNSSGSNMSAQYLLMEAEKSNWGVNETRTIVYVITPKVPGVMQLKIRGWLSWNGYNDVSRDPASSGSGIGSDQQGYFTFERTVTVNVTQPDLIITSINAPSSAQVGETLQMSFNIQNIGNQDAPLSSTGIRLSLDQVFGNGDDIFLADRQVGSLLINEEVNSGLFDVTIPNGTMANNYYLLVKADAPNLITETSETNNLNWKNITLIGDQVSPIVMNTNPMHSQNNVPINSYIDVEFSETINSNTINNQSQSFLVYKGHPINGDIIQGNISQLISTTFRFTPNSNLEYWSYYTVKLVATIEDLAGNTLDGNFNGLSEGTPNDDYEWVFYTENSNNLPIIKGISVIQTGLLRFKATVKITDQSGAGIDPSSVKLRYMKIDLIPTPSLWYSMNQIGNSEYYELEVYDHTLGEFNVNEEVLWKVKATDNSGQTYEWPNINNPLDAEDYDLEYQDFTHRVKIVDENSLDLYRDFHLSNPGSGIIKFQKDGSGGLELYNSTHIWYNINILEPLLSQNITSPNSIEFFKFTLPHNEGLVPDPFHLSEPAPITIHNVDQVHSFSIDLDRKKADAVILTGIDWGGNLLNSALPILSKSITKQILMGVANTFDIYGPIINEVSVGNYTGALALYYDHLWDEAVQIAISRELHAEIVKQNPLVSFSSVQNKVIGAFGVLGAINDQIAATWDAFKYPVQDQITFSKVSEPLIDYSGLPGLWDSQNEIYVGDVKPLSFTLSIDPLNYRSYYNVWVTLEIVSPNWAGYSNSETVEFTSTENLYPNGIVLSIGNIGQGATISPTATGLPISGNYTFSTSSQGFDFFACSAPYGYKINIWQGGYPGQPYPNTPELLATTGKIPFYVLDNIQPNPPTLSTNDQISTGNSIAFYIEQSNDRDLLQYEVYRQADGEPDFTLLSTLEIPENMQTLFFSEEIDAQHNFVRYKVKAIDNAGNKSNFSDIIEFNPVTSTELIVNPTNLNVSSFNSNYNINISQNGPGSLSWSASIVEGQSWLSFVGQNSGVGDGTIEINCPENLLTISRQGKIRIEAPGALNSPQDIIIIQAGSIPHLVVIPEYQDVSSNSNLVEFSVTNSGTGSMNWNATITNGNNWLSIVSGNSGTNSGVIQVQIAQNLDINSRTGRIKIESIDADNSPIDVTIIQQASGISNSSPVLSWVNEVGYISDGVHPDEDLPGSSFTFQVEYADADDNPPGSGYPKVHILKGGTGISGSPFIMTEVNSNPFTSGRNYQYAMVLNNTGDDYTYFFSATDDQGATAIGDATVTQSGLVVNTPPVAANVAIAPTNPGPSDPLMVTYDYSDADNHLESGSEYRWYRNGVEIPNQTAVNLPANETSSGDDIYATVKPGDGIGLGNTVQSPTVTIFQSSTGLLAYYPFSNDSPEDASGNGYHGQKYGDTSPTSDRFGNADQAYAFDGDGDYIDLGSLNIGGLNSFTVVAWVKITQNDGMIIAADNGDPDRSFYLYSHSNDKIESLIYSDNSNYLYQSSMDVINDGRWHQVVLVRDGMDAAKLYVDAHPGESSSISGNTNFCTSMFIGKRGYQNFELYFNGAIDDVRLYSYSLSDADIRNLYHDNGFNSLPSVADVAIQPLVPSPDQDLQLNYTYTDVDGDPEAGTEIKWYRNGSEIIGQNTTTLPASETADGDEIYATVRPHDGIGFGDPATAPTVTVTAVNPLTLAYWTFDEGSGSTVNDLSGNNHTGTISGATWTGGFIGSALSYDGSNDYVAVPTGTQVAFNQEMTVEALIYLTSPLTHDGYIVSNWSSGNIPAQGNAGFLIGFLGDYLYFDVATAYNAWQGVPIAKAEVPVNQWVHIAGVRTAAELKIYLNGVEKNSIPATQPDIYNPDQPIYIGAQPGGANFFAGIIDEIRISSTALDPASFLQIPNQPPQLTWTGEIGYESDGLEPEAGITTATFTFRIKYSDPDSDAPQSEFPKLYIKKGGAVIGSGPLTMNEANTDPFSTGRIYTVDVNDLEIGNDYSYYFEAYDSQGNLAAGDGTTEQSGPVVNLPIVSILPTQNALNIAPDANIEVVFGQALDATSVTSGTFKVSGAQSGVHTSSNITYDDVNYGIAIDPDVDFKPGEIVTVTLTTDILFSNGMPLPQSFTWSFVIQTVPETGGFTHAGYISGGPNSLIAADFNDDGWVDMAGSDYTPGTLHIYINNGSAGFAPEIIANVGTAPWDLTAADFDGDGDVDIAVANEMSNDATILMNDGSGGFTIHATIAVGNYPRGITQGDFDGDGDIDLAVGCNTAGIFILDNDGSGNFTQTLALSGANRHGMVAADFNNDGFPDLLSSGGALLVNDQAGNFNFLTGFSNGFSVAAADFNGDGLLDIAQGRVITNDLRILRNDAGTFSETQLIAADGIIWSICAGDFDGDGDQDLVIADEASPTLTLLVNDGNGTFAPGSFDTYGGQPKSIGGADFDGDGDVDLAVSALEGNNVTFFGNGTHGQFVLSTSLADSLALVALYNSTDGQNWTNNTNWLTIAPLSSWYGATMADGRVSILDLHQNGLSGTLPLEIGDLTGLGSLQLNSNNLTDAIPPEIGNLTNLWFLNLSFNQLNDTLPSEIGNMVSLQNLLLYVNQLSGELPAELGSLSNLQVLQIYGNDFTGAVPGSFANLSNLTNLYLFTNRFEGLPDLSGITSLTSLSVANNHLEFDDVEPNIGIASFSYSPQADVGSEDTLFIAPGASQTLSAVVGGSANQYQWFKDGAAIAGANESDYLITSATVNDTGIYTCEITNSIATALTLQRKPITVMLLPAPVLSWTGEAGYTTDGVDPDNGDPYSTFTFRIEYLDPQGTEPLSGYPQLSLKKGGIEINGSPFTMTPADNNPFTSGRIYTFSIDSLMTGNDYTYQFTALNENGTAATGEGTVEQSGPQVAATQFTAVTAGPVVSDSGFSRSVAWGDYDNDGYLDLLITNWTEPNYLYHNDGPPDYPFTRITGGDIAVDNANSAGSAWGDYDNDGDLDLFIANSTGYDNFLYQNSGAPDYMLSRVTTGTIVNDGGQSVGCAWEDYDRDGDLDLFVANNDEANFLYRNDGPPAYGFTKITAGALVEDIENSLGCSWADYDGDGYSDLFIANLNGENNALYHNDGPPDYGFTRVLSGAIVTDGGSSRGGSWGDYDNDGDLDLLVANQDASNFLYQNNGDGSFTKVASGVIVSDIEDSGGSGWADYDLDGDLDLFVASFIGTSYNDVLYRNDGAGTFVRIAGEPLVSDTGKSFGCAWGDYDNDGDPDLAVANWDGQNNFLYRNNQENRHWLQVQLQGQYANRDGVGAMVQAKANIAGNPLWQTRQVSTQTGLYGQEPLRLTFGVQDAAQVDSLVIRWPSGTVQVLPDVDIGQLLTVTENGYAGPGWYVDAAYNSAAVSDGSPNLPFTTLNAALSRIALSNNPTDTIYIADGLYDEALNFPRRDPMPELHFRAWGSATPQLTHSSIDPHDVQLNFYAIQFNNTLTISGSAFALNGAVNLDNCRLENGFQNAETGDLNITRSWIQGPVNIFEESNLLMQNNLIAGDLRFESYGGAVLLDRNTILGGIEIVNTATYGSHSYTITNNILSCPASCAVGIDFQHVGAVVNISHNDIFGFDTAVQGFDTTGLSIITEDPLFANILYQLYDNSPCIGAGIGGIELGLFGGIPYTHPQGIREISISAAGLDFGSIAIGDSVDLQLNIYNSVLSNQILHGATVISTVIPGASRNVGKLPRIAFSNGKVPAHNMPGKYIRNSIDRDQKKTVVSRDINKSAKEKSESGVSKPKDGGLPAESVNGFTLIDDGEFILAPGDSQSVTIRFLPPDVGVYSATLEINHDATNQASPLQIILDGEGIMVHGTLGIVTARAVNHDISLSWNALSGASDYEVYRETSPYQPLPATPYATVSDTFFVDIDAVGVDTTDYFYRIRALSGVTEIALSKEVGKYDFQLQLGWNLISLPLIIDQIAIDSVIGTQLTGGNSPVESDVIYYYNGSSYVSAWLYAPLQKWFGTLTTIEPDRGYWIQIQDGHPGKLLTFIGEVADSARQILLSKGWNMIGSCYPLEVPLGQSNLSESGFTGGINPLVSDKIYGYSEGGYDSAWLYAPTAGWFGTLQLLRPNKGYWIYILPDHEGFTWHYTRQMPIIRPVLRGNMNAVQ